MPPHGIAAVRAHLAKLPPAQTVAERRTMYDKAQHVFTLPADSTVEPVTAGGVPAEWIVAKGAATDAAVLYLHGGGYVIGSPRSHRHLAAAVARAAGVAGLAPDYRLAPEHPFPAAVDDALAAYRWLLETKRIAPRRIVVAGDSAGGGLTVALLLAAREAGLALPGGAVCISPWTDMTASGKSYETKAASDPMVTRQGLGEMTAAYVGKSDPRGPLVSPLFADLRGLPPLLIQVGSEEVLLDDAVGLADQARAAGVEATLEVWEPMIHVWHWFLPWLDEAQAAVEKIGGFVRTRVG